MNEFIWQKNLTALKQRYPNLYLKINETQDSPEIEIFPSRAGTPTLRANKILFHSSYNPMKAEEYLVRDLDIDHLNCLIVFGFGLGYHVRKIWENPFFRGNILVIEKSRALFKKALQTIDLSSLIEDEKVKFIVEDDMKEFVKLIEGSGFFNPQMTEVDMIVHPPSRQTYPAFYLEAVKIARGLLSFNLASLGTAFRFFNYWQKNSIDNLVDFSTSPWIKDLSGCAREKTAVIVSAGPSLDNDLAELKKAQGQLFIICVGTALKALLRQGISPDLVVVVDGHEKALKQFENIEVPAGTYICAADFICNEIVEKFRPRVFFFTSSANPFSHKLVPEQPFQSRIYSGGSVAHSAIDIALRMGFDKIVLLGQDLSFKDRKTHASGTMYDGDIVGNDDEETLVKKGFLWLKGNYQEKVLSNPSFYTFLASLERYIHMHPEVQFINCTSGGALIKGANLMKFNEALEKYGSGESVQDIRAQMASAEDAFIPATEVLHDNIEQACGQLKSVVDLLSQAHDKACQIKELLCSENVALSEKISPLAEELESLGKKMGENSYLELLIYGEGHLRFLMMNMTGKFISHDIEKQKKMYQTIDEIYQGFLDSARYIIQRFETMLEEERIWKRTAPIN